MGHMLWTKLAGDALGRLFEFMSAEQVLRMTSRIYSVIQRPA